MANSVQLRATGLLLIMVLAAIVPPAAVAQSLSAEQAAAIDRVFAHYARRDSPGCVVGVGQAGVVAYRQGYGMASLEHDVPLSPFTISEIGSVSKQFTAAAIVLLVQDGKLSLDDEVRAHFPEFPAFDAPITIRHMLNHTSGVRDQFGLLELVGRPNGEVVTTVDEVVELALAQRTLNFAPNTEYLYSNTGYTFMNALVERVSGRSFAEFTTERIFTPLGMADTQWRGDYRGVVRGRALAYSPNGQGGHLHNMPFSNLHGSGGLLTTVQDLITWTQALHADHVGRPGFLAEMTRRARLNDGSELSYALGLTIAEHRGVREVGHGGSTAGYRAYLAHYPDAQLTVALQCNVSSANAAALAREVAAVILGDRLAPPAGSARPFALRPGELEERAGLYLNPVTYQVVRLAARDGRLVGGGLELVPSARDRFSGGGREYRYVAARSGRGAELHGDDGSVLVAMARAQPTAQDLSALTGEYHNAELGATVRVSVENGQLTMRYPPARVVVFEPAFANAFIAGGRTIVFEPSGAGAPAGFAYHAGRVRNIRFERMR